MLTKEQYHQLNSIRKELFRQLDILDEFMVAHRPQAEDRQDFLNELSAKDGQYHIVQDNEMVEPQPEIPNDAELEKAAEQLANPTAKDAEQPSKAELIEEARKRLGLDEMDIKTLIPLDRWQKLCGLVITGWQGKEVAKASIDNTLIKEGFALSGEQERHLEQLRGIRREMLAKRMDLNAAKGQNGVQVWEHAALETLAKENNLK